MPHTHCSDVQIYYETAGEGPPLLLVSGLGGGSWSWQGQRPAFERHFRVIRFDNRGSGRSDMPPGPYTMEQLAKDALAILDELGIDRAAVMGLSMGGMIALQLTVMAQDRVSALVLGCTHCGGAEKIGPRPEVLERFIDNSGLTQEEIVEKNLAFFLGPHCHQHQPEIVDQYRRYQLQNPIQPEPAFQAQLAAIQSFDCCSRLSRIRVPTLVVSGSEDILVPIENARLLASRIPNATLVELAKAGHAIHFERRERLNELVLRFLIGVLEEGGE